MTIRFIYTYIGNQRYVIKSISSTNQENIVQEQHNVYAQPEELKKIKVRKIIPKIYMKIEPQTLKKSTSQKPRRKYGFQKTTEESK